MVPGVLRGWAPAALLHGIVGLLFCGVVPGTRSANAMPLQDPDAIWTVQIENDAVSTIPGGSDKYYTAGQRIGWTSATDTAPQAVLDAATWAWGPGVTRLSVDLFQQIFTPYNTNRSIVAPDDRPAAAILAGTFGVLHDTDTSRTVLAATVGLIGPNALGRVAQNGVHQLIGDSADKAWASQLPNAAALNVQAERTWRAGLANLGGLEIDALPGVAVGLGTVRDYGQASLVLRFGQGLDSDFGAARLRPGITGGDAYMATRDFAWYAFAGVDGQAVARDAFLDGDLFRKSHTASRIPFLAEMEAGAAVIWRGVRISYTQTWQTQSFERQKKGLFNFGSFAASVKF